MHVKNIYPTTTTNEDLIGLAEMASTYLSSMPAALATNEILAVPTARHKAHKRRTIIGDSNIRQAVLG